MSRLEQLEKLFSADPTDAELPYMIAHEHAKRADHEAAVEWFDRCLTIDADHLYCYFHKARSLESLDRIADALETLKTGLARAKTANDDKAINEIEGCLSQLGGLG